MRTCIVYTLVAAALVIAEGASRYSSSRLLYAVSPSDLAPSGSGMHLYSYRIG
jgi:hypothetical protein